VSCSLTITSLPHQPQVSHTHQLQLGSSPNHITLRKVCFKTICNALNFFKTNTSLFSVFCPHLHAFYDISYEVCDRGKKHTRKIRVGFGGKSVILKAIYIVINGIRGYLSQCHKVWGRTKHNLVSM